MRVCRRRVRPALIAAAGCLGLPRALLACPVCFGASDSAAAQGVNMAILALLGVTAVILCAFGAFFIYLVRRANAGASRPLTVASAQGSGGE